MCSDGSAIPEHGERRSENTRAQYFDNVLLISSLEVRGKYLLQQQIHSLGSLNGSNTES